MKQQTYFAVLMAILIQLGLSACHKDPVVEPSEPLPPQQQLPNPLPANALVKQLKWTDLDHITFTYNALNQVQQVRSQWQYVQGDPTQIKSITYDLEYDAQHKPVRISTEGGLDAKYFYDGERLVKSQELNQQGKVMKEVTYSYTNNRISQELWRIPAVVAGEPDDIYKHVFAYDSKGNLNKIAVYEQKENLQYILIETTEYSDFDDKINPTSWMLRYPYLPQMRLQFNNPRKEVRKTTDSTPRTTTYAYEYNQAGVPISKQTILPTGISSVQHVY